MTIPASTAPLRARDSPVLGRIGFWLPIVLVCAAFGALYGVISPYGRPWIGALYGGTIGTAVMAFERGLIVPRWRGTLRRLPLAFGVIGTELTYLVIIHISSALAGTVLKLTGLSEAQSWFEATVPGPTTILYSLVVSGLVISVSRMRDLIGAEVFRNLMLGRYHQPVEEERIFLFVDLIGSTAYAQAHGDLRAQAFLGAIFTALADPVRRCRGSIDDYVGDMALITWPLKAGITDARCVACVLDFFAAIAAEGERWRREYGQVPEFRAALHGGQVVTAEVGLDRHKIAYFGDAVNTTGRLEGLCRVLDAPVLISSDLLDRLPALPAGVVATSLGAHALKGRGETLSVFRLDAAAAVPVPAAKASLAAAEAVPSATAA